MKVNIQDLISIYEKEVSRNTKNKDKVYRFEKYKMLNISNIKNIIESGNFFITKYNIFYIYEPKLRIIMSLDIGNRIIDHYIAKHILLNKLDKYLDIRNVASRKNMGMNYGINLVKKYIEKHKKYNNFYVLKLDIKKYFYTIDHEVLKKQLKKYLNKEELSLVSTFINSTNAKYVNKRLSIIKDKLLERAKTEKQRQEILDIPYYEYGKGLTIGNVCSQILSIFYLSSLDYYIIHTLKCKYMVRYCDDLIIFHHNKEYLKYVFEKIVKELDKYKLKINKKKSFITNTKYGFIFCGNYIKVDNNKTIIKRCSESKIKIRRNIRKKRKLYLKGKIRYRLYFNSANSYKLIKS